MWVVAKTKACQEKRALNNLENQGFTVFLPYIIVKKFKKNIWNIQKELLFPGYIFVDISSNNHLIHKINNTLGVFRLLADPETGLPSVLSEYTVTHIKNNIDKSLNINDISVGDNVIYTNGALSNIEGIVTEVSGKTRIKLLINLLNTQREICANSLNVQRVYTS
jgi:transcriptional antiterminator RfaH